MRKKFRQRRIVVPTEMLINGSVAGVNGDIRHEDQHQEQLVEEEEVCKEMYSGDVKLFTIEDHEEQV